MTRYNAPFEIHVHGDVALRPEVGLVEVAEALKPLWKYAGARSLEDGAASAYDDEPGIRHDKEQNMLHLCWTVSGDQDFRQSLDDLCMGLNDLASAGAVLEVTFYDAEFDEEDESRGMNSRDDFVMLFIGPTPAAIMQVQRDLLIEDVVQVMERHFEAGELNGVIQEIDRLFSDRFDNLVSSLELGKPPRGGHGGSGGHGGGGRKPRHLH